MITRTSLSKKQLMCFLIWIPPPLTSDPSFSTTMPTRTLVELPISNWSFSKIRKKDCPSRLQFEGCAVPASLGIPEIRLLLYPLFSWGQFTCYIPYYLQLSFLPSWVLSKVSWLNAGFIVFLSSLCKCVNVAVDFYYFYLLIFLSVVFLLLNNK